MLRLMSYGYAYVQPQSLVEVKPERDDLTMLSEMFGKRRDEVVAISLTPDVDRFDIQKYEYDYLGEGHLIVYNTYDEAKDNWYWNTDSSYLRIEFWGEGDNTSVMPDWYHRRTIIEEPVNGGNRKFIWVKEKDNAAE